MSIQQNPLSLPIEAASPPTRQRAAPATQSTQPWQRVALGVILALAAFLILYQVQINGYGNSYYAAAVRSMLSSWHNFFFVSFDPGGFVSVDKPPLGLWIEALSALVFGFSGFSLLLPQALAGLAGVLLIYHLVRRRFGPTAGLIAALILALTPISVVMSRDNNQDMMMVLFLLLATWWGILATERGKLGWLLLCAVMVGLAFNVKALEAYLVMPALGLLYLLGAPGTWLKRIWHLALALLVLLTLSLSWMVIVDSTPASQRPYVGSSQTNSEIELALGYNGIERITGMRFGNRSVRAISANEASGNGDFPIPTGGGGGLMNEGGSPSPLRLFRVELGGQVSWFLPLALISLFVLAWQTRLRVPLAREHQEIALWGVWLVTTGTFFSIASFYHSYYLVIVAPAIAALSGIGLVLMWQEYRERPLNDWRTWTLPAALLLTAAEQVYLLTSYGSWSTTLTPLIVVGCLLAAVGLIVGKLQPRLHMPEAPSRIVQRAAVILALLTLVLTPLAWSFISDQQASNPTLPTAGPELATNDFPMGFGGRNFEAFAEQPGFAEIRNSFAGMRGGRGFEQQVDNNLLRYLEQKQGSTRFLFATQSSMTAAPYIIQTGKAVMALGGFTGTDPILDQQSLAALVKQNTVRFFLLPSQQFPTSLPAEMREQLEGMFGGNGGGMFGSASGITSWVQQNCKIVPNSAWQSTSAQNTGATPPSGRPPGTQGGFPGGAPGNFQGTPPAGFPGGAPGNFSGTPPAGFPGGAPGSGEANNGPGSSAAGPGNPGQTGGSFMMNQQLYDCSAAS